jgi:hypothetical protein
MTFGIVLPSHVYKPERVRLVAEAFHSLERTVTDPDNKPKLLLILKLTSLYHYYSERLLHSFDLECIPDPKEVQGTEQTLAYGTQYLFDQGCEVVTWMGDDALFHPMWHKKLEELIAAKPGAVAWSVYRSAYEEVHKTLETDGPYVRVGSICGHGMTFSKEEWQRWGIQWQDGGWCSDRGDTLDLHHSQVRQGERWVTKVSYIEHTGRVGLHCRAHIPEYAVDFQGI